MLEKGQEYLRETDPEIFSAISEELARQRNGIELIASENFVSRAVLAAMGSVMTNKYAEGYPHARYYGGCHVVDKAEDLARDMAKALFGCDHVNVQPMGKANIASFLVSSVEPSLHNLATGHLTHGFGHFRTPYNVIPMVDRKRN